MTDHDNSSNRLTEIGGPSGATMTFTYDAGGRRQGRLASTERGNVV